MHRTFVEGYKGHTLRCVPQETHDGKFLAFMIISRDCRDMELEFAGLLDLPAFDDKDDAALAGLGAAIEWADERSRSSESSAVVSPVLVERRRLVERRALHLVAGEGHFVH